MDGETWVRMEIQASQAYKPYIGSNYTPRLAVECRERGKKRSFSILLYSGLLESAHADSAFSPLPSGQRLLRTKIDDDKPRWRSWGQLTDGSTYEYVGGGETGMSMYPASRFIKDVFSARRLLVEFQPYEWNGTFTSEFEVQGLREEFDGHQECKAK